MGTTPKYAWPYPELTDPPDGAGQIKALATAVENQLNAPAVTYTPSLAGITLGNGILTARYCRVGSLITASVMIAAAPTAPTTAWTGSAKIGLPFLALQWAAGSCFYIRSLSGGPYYNGIMQVWGSNFAVMDVAPVNVSGTNTILAAAASWGTGAWATDATFACNISYFAAPI